MARRAKGEPKKAANFSIAPTLWQVFLNACEERGYTASRLLVNFIISKLKEWDVPIPENNNQE
jgi:hypothetical protein